LIVLSHIDHFNVPSGKLQQRMARLSFTPDAISLARPLHLIASRGAIADHPLRLPFQVFPMLMRGNPRIDRHPLDGSSLTIMVPVGD